MRHLPIIVLLSLVTGVAHAAPRVPLDLPVRYPGSSSAHVPAPAYAGDVVELRLTPAATKIAGSARGQGGRFARLGLAGLDGVASSLGGAWFQLEFSNPTALPGHPGLADLRSFYIAHLPEGVTLEEALDRLGSLPEVEKAGPVAILPVSATVPNDSLWSSSYWFYQSPSRLDLHAPEAWDITTGDTSVVVAILDTGVLLDHPDIGGTVAGLPGQIWTNWNEAAGLPGVDDDLNGFVDDVHGWDFVSLSASTDAADGEDWGVPDNDPDDYAAHGTAIAGLVGALTDNTHGVAGTAWKVRLMPLRIGWACYGTSVGCGEVRMDFVANAVDYATRNGAQVINCSFESLNQAGLGAALDRAAAAGLTIVSAAGNNALLVNLTNNYLATRPDVIAVASIDRNDVLSPFTNYGPEVDLCAPGQQIASTWLFHNPLAVPSYHPNLAGTSVSSPMVAGAAALVQARQHQLGRAAMSPEGIALRLEETADDIGAVNPSRIGQYGAGRVNLFRAVSETWRSTATRMGGRVNGPAAVLRVNDGGSRIACATRDGMLVVLDGVTLDTLTVVPLPGNPTSGVAAGPINDAGGVGLFVGCLGGVVGHRSDGAVLAGWPALVAPGVQFVSPAVGDLDGDGAYEVVCGADDGQVWAWHAADGLSVTGFPARVAAAGVVQVALANLTGSPGVQIIAAADDGTLKVLGPGGGALVPPLALGSAPTAPVEALIDGAPTIVIVAGQLLHEILPNGTERAGFPVILGGSVAPGQELAIGDLDLDGHEDVVLATEAPSALDVRDSTGVSESTHGWPRPLNAVPLGSPVIGQVAGDLQPEAMVMLGPGLSAFTSGAGALAGFPKPGGAGARPTLADLDGDGTTEVVAGSGPASPVLYIYDAGLGTAGAGPNPWPTFRGNVSRTGSRVYAPVTILDVIAPATVTDLRAEARGSSAVTLLWTAPGDDGPVGRAAFYDLRRSGQPIDDASFGLATPIPAGAPGTPGTTDSLRVGGLVEGVHYHFALRTRDGDGNVSPTSNDLAVTVAVVSPAAVTDLRAIATTDTSVTLRWTATGGDGTSGRPRLYVVRADTSPISDANFLTAPYERIVQATVDAGGTETLLFRFLERGRRYWFALKAYDAGGNGSPLSDVIVAQTAVGGPLDGRTGLALAPGANPAHVPARLYWQADPRALGARQAIRIHDLGGRRVRTIDLGANVGGVVSWDGRDDDGRRLPAGLYLVRLESGGYHVRARLVLIP